MEGLAADWYISHFALLAANLPIPHNPERWLAGLAQLKQVPVQERTLCKLPFVSVRFVHNASAPGVVVKRRHYQAAGHDDRCWATARGTAAAGGPVVPTQSAVDADDPGNHEQCPIAVAEGLSLSRLSDESVNLRLICHPRCATTAHLSLLELYKTAIFRIDSDRKSDIGHRQAETERVRERRTCALMRWKRTRDGPRTNRTDHGGRTPRTPAEYGLTQT